MFFREEGFKEFCGQWVANNLVSPKEIQSSTSCFLIIRGNIRNICTSHARIGCWLHAEESTLSVSNPCSHSKPISAAKPLLLFTSMHSLCHMLEEHYRLGTQASAQLLVALHKDRSANVCQSWQLIHGLHLFSFGMPSWSPDPLHEVVQILLRTCLIAQALQLPHATPNLFHLFSSTSCASCLGREDTSHIGLEDLMAI